MCGRFTLTASPADVTDAFGLHELDGFPPRYNIAPTQPILTVLGGREERPDANHPGREGRLVRWGFLPAWLKETKGFPLLFNARSETAASKNTFKAAMTYRRCLVPASGFYEWKKSADGKTRQAYFLKPRSGRPIGFAGLMETYLAPEGSEIDTAAILTTSANRLLRPIHERMPVVVPEGAFERWLNCREFSPADIIDILEARNEGVFEVIPVSDRVNAVANTAPDIQTPVSLAAKAEGGDKGNDEGPAQASLF